MTLNIQNVRNAADSEVECSICFGENKSRKFVAHVVQVERVVGYAMTRGAHKFAALVPKNAYGALVAQVFQQAVMQKGGIITADGKSWGTHAS